MESRLQYSILQLAWLFDSWIPGNEQSKKRIKPAVVSIVKNHPKFLNEI
jgi:hypothetical protein